MVHLGIVGYRGFTDYEKFSQLVDEYIEEIGSPEFIISGGAKGTDTMAEKYAQDHNIQTKIFKPDWEKHGKGAGIMRNTDIIQNSTHVIAFLSQKSIGTIDSINKAKKFNKLLKIIDI
ncbi:protein of unknown function DUF2493 [Klosneuvirus KNV1]|uniref:YspA cpYpsA-related SLOG domain-containing protein n=1 Tax=Klosneuvirus KNV1 TaxID=1977640 RepID=A0A1V0SKD6_9VIRU|nr:protein of unknown function DUF2493 [Klosneuvirus KNV1]